MTDRSFREALFDSEPKPEKVVLLMGIPAAGKTTWIRQNALRNRLYLDSTLDSPKKRKPWVMLAKKQV